MTTDTEDLLWRRFNEWFRARRPDYPSEWDAFQAGHAAAKAETAAAVAKERERASVLYDMLLNRPALNAGLESEYAAWTSKCYQVTGAYKAAIRAGAPPDTLRDAARGATRERCGWDKARCDVHHRVARCDGGLNTISNGEVICPNCHRVAHEQSGGGEA